MNGLAGKEFEYADVLVCPANLTDFLMDQIELRTRFSKRVPLNIPLVSASMDTITEADLAIALALLGGVGVLHYNYPSIDAQAADAARVKRYENGFVENPVTVAPEDLVDTVAEIRTSKGISVVPVTENGRANGRLLGIITKDDYSLHLHRGRRVAERMVPFSDLTVGQYDDIIRDKEPLEAANRILLESHKSTLPIVDNKCNLVYLVTRSDIEKNEQFPYAAKDSNKRLRVFAAIESRLDRAEPRMAALAPYVDGFVIDTAHGYFSKIAELLKYAKAKHADHDFVAGNVAVAEAVEHLAAAGADGVRVGTGPGDVCDTWDVTGTGRLQGSAVYECAQAGLALDVPINADGGIRYSGDITKALALGAHTVTSGSLLAGTDETPGDFIWQEGRQYKKYRGMGSAEAMQQGSGVRYSVEDVKTRVPEGKVKLVESKGSLSENVGKLIQGLRQGMFKAGCRTIADLHKNAVLVPKRLTI